MLKYEKVVWIHLLFRGDAGQQALRDDYTNEFESRNLIATIIPTLNFEFKNLEELARLIEVQINGEDGSDSDPIGGLIITSPRVVEALKRAEESVSRKGMHKKSALRDLNPENVFVVGERSAQELESKLGLKCNLSSTLTGNSFDMTKYIETFCAHQLSAVNLLYPKGSLADNSIEGALSTNKKIRLKPIVVYETVATENLAAIAEEKIKSLRIPEGLSKLIINMIFFSPSGVESFRNMDQNMFLTRLRSRFSKCDIEFKYSSIGKTTEAALLRNNMIVFCVSDKPNPVSLVNCITRNCFCQ